MNAVAALVQPHAAAIIDSLVALLDSPDSRAKLTAAKLILRWAWGPAGARREEAETVPAGGLSYAEEQRAVELLLPHLRPDGKGSNPAATSCPARHEGASPAGAPIPPRANPAINPMSLEDGAPPPAQDAAPATDTVPTNPVINPHPNPMSRERSPSPLAAPPGTDPPYSSPRDADPMSRALLLARHSADDAFRRPLPQPPPVEPPWPFVSDAQWRPPRRRWR